MKLTRARGILGTLACAGCAVLAALPADAAAHAVLESAQPARGAALERAPKQVSLSFNEPIESSFGALRVFNADGERVDRGSAQRPSGSAISVQLRNGLSDGPYTATYRVVSADSHPVVGGYVFTVGKAGGLAAASVAELLDAEAGPVTETAFGVVRAVGYGAIALLIGGLVFLTLVWLPSLRAVGGAREGAGEAFEHRAGRLLVGAALAGLLSTVLGIVLQGATASGGSFWSALDTGVIHDVLNTRFGTVWKLRVTAFGLLVPLLLYLPALRGRREVKREAALELLRNVALVLALAYLAVSPALAGHAAAGDQAALLVPLDVLHVLAMSVWVGGVALLALVVPVATRLLDPPDRTRLLATAVSRFSTIALAAVVALLATGIFQSILHLDAFADLVDTAFGRAILVKSSIFVALVAIGAHNRRRSQPALARLASGGEPPGRAGLVLRRALRAEVGLMVLVLGVTAALVSYSPSAGVQSGPFSGTAELGPARLELTVDPARVGRNEVHVYLFNRGTGAQYDRPSELAISAAEPERGIGPLELRVRKAGPGHYTAPVAELVPGGDWDLTVRARISEFEELRAELEVPVR